MYFASGKVLNTLIMWFISCHFLSKRTDFEIMQHLNVSVSFIAFHIKWGEAQWENPKQIFYDDFWNSNSGRITNFFFKMEVHLFFSVVRSVIISTCHLWRWEYGHFGIHFALKVWLVSPWVLVIIFDLGQIISFCYCILLDEVTREFRTQNRNYKTWVSPPWRVYTYHACFPYSDLFRTHLLSTY